MGMANSRKKTKKTDTDIISGGKQKNEKQKCKEKNMCEH